MPSGSKVQQYWCLIMQDPCCHPAVRGLREGKAAPGAAHLVAEQEIITVAPAVTVLIIARIAARLCT